ncbi:MAG: O-antigen ligase family protein [Clostridia bacterium]|nr:O-antigen ligase family protein [Clostridia bacterium]
MSRNQTVLDKISSGFFSILTKSFIGRFFTSYDKDNEKFAKHKPKKPHSQRSLRTRILKSAENSPVLSGINKAFSTLMRLSLRDYGIMLFVMGAIIAGLYPLTTRGLLLLNISFEYFIYGAGICIVSLPLLFSSRSLASGILASKLMSFIVIDFLGYDEESIQGLAEKNRISITNWSILIGCVLAVGAYFISPLGVFLLALIIAITFTVLCTPEVGAVITIFLLPFVDVKILCVAMLITATSYLIKVFFGKRVCHLEYLDIFAGVSVLAIVLFGINPKNPIGSLTEMLQLLVLALAYLVYSNLIRDKEWFRKCIRAFTSSVIIVSVVAIIQAILERLSEAIEALSIAFPYDGVVSSTFENPQTLALFLVIAIPFALAHLFAEKNELGKFGGFMMLGVMICSLFLTGSRLAVIGVFVGAIFLLIAYNRNFIHVATAILITVPVIYFALPEHITDQILSIFGTNKELLAQLFVDLKDQFLLAIKNPLGYGLNVDVNSVFPEFTQSYFDSLPLQFVFNFGIIALVVLLVFAIVFARLVFSYCVVAKNKYRKISGCAGICALLGAFAVGIFDYIWLDNRMFFLCTVCLALSFAYIKIEREGVDIIPQTDFFTANLEVELSEEDDSDSNNRSKYIHMPKKKDYNKKMEAKEFSNAENLIKNEMNKIENKDEEE